MAEAQRAAIRHGYEGLGLNRIDALVYPENTRSIRHIYDAFESQQWFIDRGLSGLTGILTLLEEWYRVTTELYDRAPFPKIKIANP